MLAVLIVIVIGMLPLTTVAHPGKTDRYGGHKCIKECAEWDLFYSEYHTHDKDGKPMRVARKKQVRSKPEASLFEKKVVDEGTPADRPEEARPSLPVAVAAAAAVEPATSSLPWILLILFLLLLLIVRRNRRKASDVEQAGLS